MCTHLQNRQNIKRKLRSFVQFALFSMLFSGCATLDFPPFSKFNQAGEKPKDSNSYGRTSVFQIPDDKSELAVENTKSFPFEAPSLKLPAPRLEVNHEVRRELTSYLRNNARSISDGFTRQENLFPVLAKIFRDEGLPEELLNLALIESGFKADVVSPMGAVGLWQFMRGTARLYGLEVSRKVDERKDPILSTMAAARCLKELYVKYNDWYLVLAAYNAGEGSINRALAKQERQDYWAIARSNSLMAETTRFVPKFIAASILQKLHSRYGSQVQLAKYLDRHIVSVSDAGSQMRYAFLIEDSSAVKRG